MIPLPSTPPPRRRTPATSAAVLVAAFLDATDRLGYEDTAALAGVCTETIRNWRRRLPSVLRKTTTQRLEAYLHGTDAPEPSEGFHRVFARVLHGAARKGLRQAR